MHDTVEKVKADYKDILNDEHIDKPMNAPPVGFVLKKNIKIVPYRAPFLAAHQCTCKLEAPNM